MINTNTNNTDSILTGCYRCPTCHLLPILTIDYDYSMPYSLSCTGVNHKHMADGYTVPMAVRHWNIYVQYIANKDINHSYSHYTSKTEQAIFKGLYGISNNEGIC